MNPEVYRKNRAAFPPAELAALHGQWVGFSQDGRRIIASCQELDTLDKMIIEAGESRERVALERIELEDLSLVAAEFT